MEYRPSSVSSLPLSWTLHNDALKDECCFQPASSHQTVSSNRCLLPSGVTLDVSSYFQKAGSTFEDGWETEISNPQRHLLFGLFIALVVLSEESFPGSKHTVQTETLRGSS